VAAASPQPRKAGVGHVGGPPVRPEDVPGFASRTGTLEGRPCGPKVCFDRDTDRHAEGSPVRPAGVSGVAFLDSTDCIGHPCAYVLRSSWCP